VCHGDGGVSLKKIGACMFIYVIGLSHFVWQVENYRDELEEMKGMTRQEYVAHLRRLVL
jgi:hypothetical protein